MMTTPTLLDLEFWCRQDGTPVLDFSEIEAHAVLSGAVRPVDVSLQEKVDRFFRNVIDKEQIHRYLKGFLATLQLLLPEHFAGGATITVQTLTETYRESVEKDG